MAANLTAKEFAKRLEPLGSPEQRVSYQRSLTHGGEVERAALLRFLDEHTEQMTQAALRNAIAHLGADERDRYLSRSRRSSRVTPKEAR
jgi:hypothetical protein